MRISILTLTQQRDGVVDERIAAALRKHGHDARVRAFATAGCDSVIYEKPDAVVVPMVGSQQKLDFVKHCHDWGIAVIVRRGEAGAAREVLGKMEKERRKVVLSNFDYAPYVDLELTWGPEFSDYLSQAKGIARNKIVACGPFTLDACFNRPKPVRAPGEKRKLLFATAFSAADDHPSYTECGASLASPLQKELYRQHRKGRDLWLNAIETVYLTKSHKYDLLLKVRPGESTAEYVRTVGQFVQVLPYEFPSADAILMSDCVIHAGSTMAIEAHLLDVPTLNFTNCNPDPRLAEVAIQCSDVGELTDALSRLSWGQSNIRTDRLEWLREHLYGPMDGKACERAAKAIHDLLKRKSKIKHQTSNLAIPNSWPHVPTYETPGVSAEPKPGYWRVQCLSCKGLFYVDRAAEVIFCPYCALTLRKIVLETAKVG